jgi:hypothetical protein
MNKKYNLKECGRLENKILHYIELSKDPDKEMATFGRLSLNLYARKYLELTGEPYKVDRRDNE